MGLEETLKFRLFQFMDSRFKNYVTWKEAKGILFTKFLGKNKETIQEYFYIYQKHRLERKENKSFASDNYGFIGKSEMPKNWQLLKFKNDLTIGECTPLKTQ